MKPSLVAVVVMMGLIACGCAQRGGGGVEVADVRRENAELKSRVTALESEVAELRMQRTPLTVNGLTIGTLAPPPELKLTSNVTRPVTERDGAVSLGQGRITFIAGGSTDAPWTLSGVGTLEKSGGATTTTTTTTTKSATSTTTTTSAFHRK